jgi:hypothetical protein
VRELGPADPFISLLLDHLQRDGDVVAQLLRRHPSLLERHSPGHRATPLCMAAAVGDPGVVLQLLEAGASVTAVDEIGASPLIMAAFKGHTEVCSRCNGWVPQHALGLTSLVTGVYIIQKAGLLLGYLLTGGANAAEQQAGRQCRQGVHAAAGEKCEEGGVRWASTFCLHVPSYSAYSKGYHTVSQHHSHSS